MLVFKNEGGSNVDQVFAGVPKTQLTKDSGAQGHSLGILFVVCVSWVRCCTI